MCCSVMEVALDYEYKFLVHERDLFYFNFISEYLKTIFRRFIAFRIFTNYVCGFNKGMLLLFLFNPFAF